MGIHSMKAVSNRTGLSPHVIRVWERRYNAVTPSRTDTNRRVYSDGDVERLVLLGQLTAEGHSISHIAQLSVEELRNLAKETPLISHPVSRPHPKENTSVEEAFQAIADLNATRLKNLLEKGAVSLGLHGLLQHLIVPLTHRIGDAWQEGEITAAHEHFASAMIRAFVEGAARPFSTPDHAPTLVVTTPAGQVHELGAVLAAATAVDLGWKVTYLGPSLPAAEIAGVAVRQKARAVALSIVYPADDPHLPAELEALRRYLPGEIAILAGGRACPSYSECLKRIGAIQMADLKLLSEELQKLRHHRPAGGYAFSG